ncbi:hypothetical protein BDF14DRAFT_709452 [Spinellus fusiger]|nr:hypothetical protein BDF14DRAFT_709452 [Spinellus fusiger]
MPIKEPRPTGRMGTLRHRIRETARLQGNYNPNDIRYSIFPPSIVYPSMPPQDTHCQPMMTGGNIKGQPTPNTTQGEPVHGMGGYPSYSGCPHHPIPMQIPNPLQYPSYPNYASYIGCPVSYSHPVFTTAYPQPILPSTLGPTMDSSYHPHYQDSLIVYYPPSPPSPPSSSYSRLPLYDPYGSRRYPSSERNHVSSIKDLWQ